MKSSKIFTFPVIIYVNMSKIYQKAQFETNETILLLSKAIWYQEIWYCRFTFANVKNFSHLQMANGKCFWYDRKNFLISMAVFYAIEDIVQKLLEIHWSNLGIWNEPPLIYYLKHLENLGGSKDSVWIFVDTNLDTRGWMNLH